MCVKMMSPLIQRGRGVVVSYLFRVQVVAGSIPADPPFFSFFLPRVGSSKKKERAQKRELAPGFEPGTSAFGGQRTTWPCSASQLSELAGKRCIFNICPDSHFSAPLFLFAACTNGIDKKRKNKRTQRKTKDKERLAFASSTQGIKKVWQRQRFRIRSLLSSSSRQCTNLSMTPIVPKR